MNSIRRAWYVSPTHSLSLPLYTLGVKNIQTQIETFVQELKALISDRMNTESPDGVTWFVKVGVEYGEKYARIWSATKIGGEYKEGDSRSVVCFVALEDSLTKGQGNIITGDILKGGWKAPVSKGKRGHISDWKKVFDFRGYLKYLR